MGRYLSQFHHGNLGEKFSENPEMIFWNEAIKVAVRHNRKPIGIYFSMAIHP
jgi:hypothetical protein